MLILVEFRPYIVVHCSHGNYPIWTITFSRNDDQGPTFSVSEKVDGESIPQFTEQNSYLTMF